MSLPVIILDDAEDELKAAEHRYEEQAPGLGADLVYEVEQAIDFAAANPRAARLATDVPPELDARQVHVKRFPFRVVFVVESGTLWVIAVAHHRRQPGYFKNRL